MLIYAGIDEAGYGPMLGPLCLGCTVFAVAEHDPASGPPNLWRRLSSAVCRSKRDKRKRIAIDDSKNLKGAATTKSVHPLHHLERGVLAMLHAKGDEIPTTDTKLFDTLQITQPQHPWYAGCTDLPVAVARDPLRIAAARLQRAMRANGVTCELLQCEVVDANELNAQVDHTGSKAAVNLTTALRLVDQIRKRFGNQHPRIVIDRHGGRVRYLRDLQLAWPEASIRVLAEEPSFSRYQLEVANQYLTITFSTEAEHKHLPVAAASMLAKYVRELFMLRMNRYFQSHQPELKPTAGYVQDARRYLADIADLLDPLGIQRERLVRKV